MVDFKKNPEFADIEGLEGGYTDPMFQHVTADQPADDGSEMVLGVAMEEVGKVLYDDGGAADVVEMLRNDQRPLYESLPEIAVPFLTKAYQVVQETAEDDEISDVMFGEGGVITGVVDALFEVAQAAGIPEAEDEDNYAAVMIGVYNKVGEHIDMEGDEMAKSQIAELGMDMATTNEDGTMTDPESFKDPKASAVTSGVTSALYGQQQPGGLLI